jgi:hypothetical protein
LQIQLHAEPLIMLCCCAHPTQIRQIDATVRWRRELAVDLRRSEDCTGTPAQVS